MTEVPAARDYTVRFQDPTITGSAGNTRIVHCEQVLAINGSDAFTVQQLQLNPGLSGSFPWLSGRASGYEKYRIHNFGVSYVPSKAVSTTVGNVCLAFDYNPDDGTPSSWANISTYESNVSGMARSMISLKAKANRLHDQCGHLQVRCGPVGGSLKFSDGASLLIATEDCADSSEVGKIYLSYDIELSSPQTEPGTKVSRSTATWRLASDQTFTSTVAADLNFDTVADNGLGLTEVGGVFTLPCAQYLITLTTRFYDTSGETLSSVIDLYIDGVTASPGQCARESLAVVATGSYQMTRQFRVDSTGSNTCSFRTTLTGAAGTLSAIADCTMVTFQVIS
jgi:hypothetical protein